MSKSKERTASYDIALIWTAFRLTGSVQQSEYGYLQPPVSQQADGGRSAAGRAHGKDNGFICHLSLVSNYSIVFVSRQYQGVICVLRMYRSWYMRRLAWHPCQHHNKAINFRRPSDGIQSASFGTGPGRTSQSSYCPQNRSFRRSAVPGDPYAAAGMWPAEAYIPSNSARETC